MVVDQIVLFTKFPIEIVELGLARAVVYLRPGSQALKTEKAQLLGAVADRLGLLTFKIEKTVAGPLIGSVEKQIQLNDAVDCLVRGRAFRNSGERGESRRDVEIGHDRKPST